MKVSELIHPERARQQAPIIPGCMWRQRPRGPWPTDTENAVMVRVIAVRDGWVRFYVNEFLPDDRLTEESFREVYESTSEYAKPGKVTMPRDELVGALEQMLEAFYYLPGNYAARDAAIRRAQLAIGAKVTL